MAYVTDPELLKQLEAATGGRNVPSQHTPMTSEPSQVSAPQEPAPDRGFLGNVANAWNRGRTELASGLMGTAAAARADDAGKVTKESYHARELSRKLREHGEKNQKFGVESWRDIRSLGDAGTFAAEQLTMGLPTLAGDIISAPTTYTPTGGHIYAEQKGDGNTNVARSAGLLSAGLGLVPYGKPFAGQLGKSVGGRMLENVGVGALGGVASGAAYDAGRNESTDGMFDNALDYAITGGTVAGAIRAPIEVAGSIKRLGSRSAKVTEDLGGVPGLNEETRINAMRNLHMDDQLNTMSGKTDLTPEQRSVLKERRKEVNDNIGTSAALKAFGDLMDEGVALSPEALRGIRVRQGLSELSPEVMSGTTLFGLPENAPNKAAARRKRSEWGVLGEHGLLGKQFSKEELANHRKLGKQSQAKDVAPFEDVVAQLQDQLAEFQVLSRDGVIEPAAARRQEAELRGMISDSRSIVKAMHDTASERSLIYDQIALRAEELSKKFDEYGINVGGKGFNPAMNASSFIYKDKFLHNQDPAYRFGIKEYADPALDVLKAGKAFASIKTLGASEVPGALARRSEGKVRQKMAEDFKKLREVAAKNGLELDLRPKAPDDTTPTTPPPEPPPEAAPTVVDPDSPTPVMPVPEEAPIVPQQAPEPTIRSVEDQPFVVNPDGSIARKGSPDDLVSLAREEARANAVLNRERVPDELSEGPVDVPPTLDTENPPPAPTTAPSTPVPLPRDMADLQRMAAEAGLIDVTTRAPRDLEVISEPAIRPEPLPRDPSEFQRLAMGEDTLANLNRRTDEPAPVVEPEPVPVAEVAPEATPRPVPEDLVRMAADEGVTSRTQAPEAPPAPRGSLMERALAETETVRKQRTLDARKKLEDKARKQGLSDEDIAKITEESQISDLAKQRKEETKTREKAEAETKAQSLRDAVGEDPTVARVERQNDYFDQLAEKYGIDKVSLEDMQTPYMDLSTNRMRNLTNDEHKVLVNKMQKERDALRKNIETPEETAKRQIDDNVREQIYAQQAGLHKFADVLEMPRSVVDEMMGSSLANRTAPMNFEQFTTLANKMLLKTGKIVQAELNAGLKSIRDKRATIKSEHAVELQKLRDAKAEKGKIAASKKRMEKRLAALDAEESSIKSIAEKRKSDAYAEADRLNVIAQKAKKLETPIDQLQNEMKIVREEQRSQREVLDELVKNNTPEQLARIADELKADVAVANTSFLNSLKNFGSEVNRAGKGSPAVEALQHQASTMHSVLDSINKRRLAGHGKVINGANGLYTMDMKRQLQAAFGSGETTTYTGAANQRAVSSAYGLYNPEKLPALYDSLAHYKLALDAESGALGRATSETTGEKVSPTPLRQDDFAPPVLPVDDVPQLAQSTRIAGEPKPSAPKSPNVTEEAFGQETNPNARVGDDAVTVVENNPDPSPIASLEPALENLNQAVKDGRITPEDAAKVVDDAAKSKEVLEAKETVPNEITKDAAALAEDENVKIVSPYEPEVGVDPVGVAFEKGYEFALIDPDKETIVRYAKNEKAAEALAKKFGYGMVGITALFSGSAMAGGLMGAYSDKLGRRESGGNYGIENTLGYVGKYQFGWPALVDLGVIKASGRSGRGQKSILGDKSNFTGKYGIRSKEDFLKNPEAQEALFEEWNNMLDRRTRNLGLDKFIGKTIDGVPVTLEGIRAASHLLGHGAVKKALTEGSLNQRDGYGTSMAEYMRLGNSVAGMD